MKFSLFGGLFLCLFLAVSGADALTVNNEISFYSEKGAPENLYLIHNYSKSTVWLVHERKNPGAGAGWDSQIDADRWSAIWMKKKRFQFACHLLTNGGNLLVPCQHYVRVTPVCTNKTPTAANSGSYWVAENLEKKALLQRIYARGFMICRSFKL